MWISTDPALGDYIPVAPTNDEAKQHNSKLPGMGGVFNHINLNCYHYAGNNPINYTDPDGRYAYSVEIEKGKFVLATSSLKGKLFDDACGFAPFGGTSLIIIKKVAGVKELNSSEFESIQNEFETFFSDFCGSLETASDTFGSLSKSVSLLSNVSSFTSMFKDVKDSVKKNSDTDIDIITSDVFSKLCNYTISGKSHDAVAKKYFIAKGVVKDLLDTGKLKYSKDWKNDITSISGSDRNTLKMLRALTKQFKTMDE